VDLAIDNLTEQQLFPEELSQSFHPVIYSQLLLVEAFLQLMRLEVPDTFLPSRSSWQSDQNKFDGISQTTQQSKSDKQQLTYSNNCKLLLN
jgi:hypothetical protein